MELFDNQSWDELSHPVRWGEAIRPAMEELETCLPALLGADIWLYRNVSWSDLARIGESGAHPHAGNVWPLMYMIGCRHNVLFGVHLKACRNEITGKKGWKTVVRAENGLHCISYAVDTKNPVSMELLLQDICQEVRKARNYQSPKWQCVAGPARLSEEAAYLSNLVKVEKGVWIPTDYGEDAGLITLFTVGKDGKTERSICWSPSTQRALCDTKAEPAPLQARIKQLERGLAYHKAYAAEAVQRLAEISLEDYFRDCPEVDASDLAKLQTALGLQKGCQFRTAAASLFRFMRQAKNRTAVKQLRPLVGMLALPIARMDDKERFIVMEKFRKGQFIV